jgi:hypothetical protein
VILPSEPPRLTPGAAAAGHRPAILLWSSASFLSQDCGRLARVTGALIARVRIQAIIGHQHFSFKADKAKGISKQIDIADAHPTIIDQISD